MKEKCPWKESVAGKKIIQGVRGDLKSRKLLRVTCMGYLPLKIIVPYETSQ